MRQLIQVSLAANIALNDPADGGVEQRIYSSSSLGVGDVPATPDLPYITHIEDPNAIAQEVQETSRSNHRVFRILVYDELGSFTRIERILALVRDTLLNLPGQQSPSGAWCLGVRQQGVSGDITDTERRHNVKHATYRLTTNR